MAQYKLHCVGALGDAYKVALYLNCAGLDWEPVRINFADGQMRDANSWSENDTMSEVPVLDVCGHRMSQSSIILMWLAEITGKFAPANDERSEAIRWILFDNHKFSANYAMYRFQSLFTPRPANPALLSFLRSQAESAFSIVDKHLTDRSFVLGDGPTIVDFSMAGHMYYPPGETAFDLKANFPAIHAWRRRLAALPGWKPPHELMPVAAFLPTQVA